MENRINIPEPCHEDWDKMSPTEQGRHCMSCCKTVVDFSTWDNESIIAYLAARKEERVCGRFNKEQVQPAIAPFSNEVLAGEIFRSHLPLLRKIAAVIVVFFGLLTAENTYAQKAIVGKPAPPQHYTKGETTIWQADTVKHQPAQPDTTFQPQIMGKIAPYHPPVKQPTKKTETGSKKNRKK